MFYSLILNLRSSYLRGQIFSRNMFSWVEDRKIATFAEFIFTIRSFIVSFTEFIFDMDEYERSKGEIIMKYM